MAIALGDSTVAVVNPKFRLLVSTDCAAMLNGLLLRLEMTARAFRPSALHVPSAARVGHDVMCFRSLFGHSRLHTIFVRYIEHKHRKFACQVSFRSLKSNKGETIDLRGKMTTTLGEKLRKHRQEKGFSLDDLARESETSKSYLWELENRDTRRPSAEKLVRLAEVLGVTAEYLLDENAGLDDRQLNEAFFRKFNKLDDDSKKRIQDMVDTWSGKKN